MTFCRGNTQTFFGLDDFVFETRSSNTFINEKMNLNKNKGELGEEMSFLTIQMSGKTVQFEQFLARVLIAQHGVANFS